MKVTIKILIFYLLFCNISFADQMLRLRCTPEVSGQGPFNLLFNLTQNKVIERNEYKVDFPIKNSSSTISFAESNLPQNGMTPIFRINIDKYSGRMTLVFYNLNKSQAKKFKKVAKKQYSKTRDNVKSYFVALNEFRDLGEFYYSCRNN